MRKRIEQLARGKFVCEQPILSFSEEMIECSVIEQEVYSGSFTITSINHVPIRGIVYSTNP